MAMTKKRSAVFAVCILCVALIVICGALFIFNNQRNENNLREKYPIIRDADCVLDFPELTFEQRVDIAPNIAEIKVVKQLPDYSVLVEDEAYGISEEVEFCQYEVKLVSDIVGTDIVTDSDGTFVITFAKDFAQSYPVLHDGTEAVCSIEAASGAHEGKYILFDKSFYYIDGKTALSAYEGDDSPASSMCSKDTLVQQIKEVRNKTA